VSKQVSDIQVELSKIGAKLTHNTRHHHIRCGYRSHTAKRTQQSECMNAILPCVVMPHSRC